MPIDEAELNEAVSRAVDRIGQRRKITGLQESSAGSNIIGVPDSKGVCYIDPLTIIYLEALNKCTKVVVVGQEVFSSYNLGRFEEMLTGNFSRIHRSFIVNLSHVKRYFSAETVLIADNRELPVSRSYRDDFLQRIATVRKQV